MTESLTSPCATLGGTPSREEVAHDIGYRVLWAANFGSFTDLRKVAREAADFLHSKPESAPLEDCEPYMREPYRSALSETPRIDDQEINHLALKVIYSLPAPMLPSHREDSIRILEAALRDVCARSATPLIPEGWKLVPTKVTDAMLDGWFETRGGGDCGDVTEFQPRYAAMIAAAPEVK